MKYTKHILNYSDSNKKVRIIFSSCQHYGSKQFSRRRFKSFLAEQLAPPQSHLILFGDTFDAIVSSDRKRYDSFEIDPRYHEKSERPLNLALKDCIEDISPYKDKLMGCVLGNHEWQLAKRNDFSLTQLLCDSLGCENLGMSFLMKLILRRNGEKNRVRSVDIYGHHGYGGGGQTSGSSLTKYEKKIRDFEAQIFVFGHDHRSWDIKLPRVGINANGKPYDKSVLMLCCGTFKKSLSKDENPTWEESRGFSPNLLGGKVVEITPLHDGGVSINCVV